MGKIYLVRHGETDWNLEKRKQGQSSTSLNEKGLQQAKKAGEQLKHLHIAAIYSSPLLRAIQTTEKVVDYHPHLDINEVDNFSEMNFGEFEGLNEEETKKKMPDYKEQRMRNVLDWRPPKGESLRELHSRVTSSFKILANKHINENIVIVAHGGVLITLLTYLLGNPADQIYRIRCPGNCEIVEVNWDGEKPTLEYE